jgi:DNA invertase Pin-like site-specific DNA recombinase
MSSDDQKLSPEQQRRAVQEYAYKHGYKILQWYVDEGVSASKGRKGDERRVAYQRLLIDSNRREFVCVLCWSHSRFTRNDHLEAAEGKRILKSNGVYLETVKEGRIDWSSDEGKIKDFLATFTDHKYSVNLGGDSLRGRHNTFLAGGYPYGTIPYGYRHLYVNLLTGERRSTDRTQQTRNMRGWIHTLELVESEAAVVRRIFDLFVHQDEPLAAIARTLNTEGVPGPGRGVDAIWTTANVRRRLACPAYVQISKIGKEGPHRGAHNRLDPQERAGDWPAIVDRDVWDAAQARLEENRWFPDDRARKDAGSDTKPRRRRGKGQAQDGPKHRSGTLQGILRCGHCGQVLAKENPRRADDPRGDKYRCMAGCNGLLVKCHRWTVFESEILPVIVRELIAAVDEETLRLVEARPDEPGRISNADVLKAHVESLEARVQEAAKAFADPGVSAVMKRALEKQVEEWDTQIRETRQRIASLNAAENRGGVLRFLDWWEGAKRDLLVLAGGAAYRVADGLSAAESDAAVCVTEGPADGPAEVCVLSLARRVGAGGPAGAEENPVLAHAPKLRALLKRLGCEVLVYWRRKERPAGKLPRGRVQEWEVDEARLKVVLNCGTPDDRSAWAACRGPSGRAGSRRPASREP